MIITQAVLNVRESLAHAMHTTDYTGLCNMACDMLRTELRDLCKKAEIETPLDYTIIHGELKHTPAVKSTDWYLQHTWGVVEFNGYEVYVDPTSSQFQDIFPDIPDYYISTQKPKWYYPDKRNWAFKFKNIIWYRIATFLQYEVWGRISDSIRYTVNHMH